MPPVACPHCSAAPGEPCTGKRKGKLGAVLTEPHHARRIAADRMAPTTGSRYFGMGADPRALGGRAPKDFLRSPFNGKPATTT
jgi:hypothetical protein